MKPEAVIGVMQPQVKERQELPEAKEDSTLELLEGASPCQYLDFGFVDFRTMRE